VQLTRCFSAVAELLISLRIFEMLPVYLIERAA